MKPIVLCIKIGIRLFISFENFISLWKHFVRIYWKFYITASKGGAVVRALPPTNVARVQASASKPYPVRVCCWFSPLLREVFLLVLRFPPPFKNQYFQIPIRSGKHGHVSTSSQDLLSAPWVKKIRKIINYN